jgi:hypothetical protein
MLILICLQFVSLPSLQASSFDGSHDASDTLHHRASVSNFISHHGRRVINEYLYG